VTDDEAVDAFEYSPVLEGIIPAIESAHPSLTREARTDHGKDLTIVVNLPGAEIRTGGHRAL
jgi:tryptophan synthase beta subunit